VRALGKVFAGECRSGRTELEIPGARRPLSKRAEGAPTANEEQVPPDAVMGIFGGRGERSCNCPVEQGAD
jgi:hypothetical protein